MMPDLANVSLSSSVTLTICPTLKISPDLPTSTDAICPNSVESLAAHCILDQSLPLPTMHSLMKVCNESGIKVFRRRRGSGNGGKRGSNGNGLEDHVTAWFEKKAKEGVPESQCSLPFLIGANRVVECLVCNHLIHPGEEVSCSVRDCKGAYHFKCVKENLGVSNVKRFKCPQHECFVCKQRVQWRCVRCPVATHDKHAPWPDKVTHLENHAGRAVCWRHPRDWRLHKMHAVARTDIKEAFFQLPLPYVDEEFNIDSILKDLMSKEGPPSYVHIRRNTYLVKKKRHANDDVGCTSCSGTCSEDCVCRVQCISCSKACRCSEACNNRPFRKEKKIKVVKTEHCGWGVEASEPISKGDFVIEYIGEVIDDALCEKRLWDMKFNGGDNFYMCELRKDFTIDATFKGNSSRFLNHSCDPNCVLEKWQVEAETRVGVFAARSIEVGEPLTYDYRFVQFGPEVKCHCGAKNCQGYLGSKKKVGKLDVCWGSKRKRSV